VKTPASSSSSSVNTDEPHEHEGEEATYYTQGKHWPEPAPSGQEGGGATCTWCGKAEKPLLEGPGVWICRACIKRAEIASEPDPAERLAREALQKLVHWNVPADLSGVFVRVHCLEVVETYATAIRRAVQEEQLRLQGKLAAARQRGRRSAVREAVAKRTAVELEERVRTLEQAAQLATETLTSQIERMHHADTDKGNCICCIIINVRDALRAVLDWESNG
jgi:hypothetical protein